MLGGWSARCGQSARSLLSWLSVLVHRFHCWLLLTVAVARNSCELPLVHAGRHSARIPLCCALKTFQGFLLLTALVGVLGFVLCAGSGLKLLGRTRLGGV
jgi:hypothetical protein